MKGKKYKSVLYTTGDPILLRNKVVEGVFIEDIKNIHELSKRSSVKESAYENIIGPYDDRIKKDIEEIVYQGFAGTDFFVSVQDIDLIEGKIYLTVGAFGTEPMEREAVLEFPSLDYNTSINKAIEEWRAAHDSPDNFYESAEENPFKIKYKAMLNGKEVKPGDKIKDFRGKEHIFKGITNPGTPFGGPNGKVAVDFGDGSSIEYYPQVFNIEIVRDELNESAKPKKKIVESNRVHKMKKREGRSLKEEVSDEAYEIAEYIDKKAQKRLQDIPSGEKVLRRDDFDELLVLGTEKVLGLSEEEKDNFWSSGRGWDFEVDIRGILSYMGYETIYETDDERGADEGDLVLIKQGPVNESEESEYEKVRREWEENKKTISGDGYTIEYKEFKAPKNALSFVRDGSVQVEAKFKGPKGRSQKVVTTFAPGTKEEDLKKFGEMLVKYGWKKSKEAIENNTPIVEQLRSGKKISENVRKSLGTKKIVKEGKETKKGYWLDENEYNAIDKLISGKMLEDSFMLGNYDTKYNQELKGDTWWDFDNEERVDFETGLYWLYESMLPDDFKEYGLTAKEKNALLKLFEKFGYDISEYKNKKARNESVKRKNLSNLEKLFK